MPPAAMLIGLVVVAADHAPRCRIGASMLACDLSRLAVEAEKVLDAGVDYLHLDVMVRP